MSHDDASGEFRPCACHGRLEPIERDLDDIRSKVDQSRLWISAHEARCTERWASQEKHNVEIAKSLRDVFRRLTDLDKRVMWISGAAAAAGGGLGAIISRVLSGGG